MIHALNSSIRDVHFSSLLAPREIMIASAALNDQSLGTARMFQPIPFAI